jgi:hypothetical protein
MRRLAILAVVLAEAFTLLAIGYVLAAPPTVPVVHGYAEGQEVTVIHTETSDPKVAQTLTSMVRSTVLVVPGLKQVPNAILGNVFVFTNGIRGGGPLGFQRDVFDSTPKDANYSPLRRLNLVTWKEGQAVRELKSVQEVMDAEAKGELALSQPGVVINMPIVTWPGGRR